jgi:hypothetical protein
VAVDGKTARGARRTDGTRVHLLGVAASGARPRPASFYTMNEDREPDWLTEGDEALRRQMRSLIETAVRQFAGTGCRAARQLTRAVTAALGAAISELSSAPEHPVVHQATASLAIGVAVSATGAVATSGSMALPPIGIGGQITVRNSSSGQAERRIGQVLVLLVLVIVVYKLWKVPERDQANVGYHLTVLELALPIAMLICSRKGRR